MKNRFEFGTGFEAILAPHFVRNRGPNRCKTESGCDLVSGIFFKHSWWSRGRSDKPENDILGGGYEGTKGGSNNVTRLSTPFHGVGGYMYKPGAPMAGRGSDSQSSARGLGKSAATGEILEYRLLAAGLGKSRQVGVWARQV